jgi:ribokinase
VTPEVVGFGALNLDYIYRLEQPRLKDKLAGFIRPGSELALGEEEFEHLLGVVRQIGKLVGKSGGGQAANTIAALSRMGIGCGYVGKLGRDEAGEYILADLQGVDKQGIQTGKHSGRCLSLLDKTGERCTIISPGCNDELDVRRINPDYLNQARLVYLSSFVGDKPLQAQVETARRLSPRVSLALDPGELYARRGLAALESLLSRCQLVFVTDEEIKLLTGEEYRRGARRLLALGTQVVVCKRGKQGAYLLAGAEEFELPVDTVPAVDKTGAGDVFAAGFIAGWLRGLSLRECVLLGHKTAAQSLMGVGRDRYPDREFLSKTVQELHHV